MHGIRATAFFRTEECVVMPSTFDHRQCPNCANSTMRLTCVEPHNPDRDDGYEWQVYRCTECGNVSRFVLERQRAAVFGRQSAA
jgi:hypothetical protein